ncbi:MAG: ATP synthase F1 subunit delta [Phycisphaerae bacterium]|nr:ATP synthase F1 subunit delta [Phycisphaerae bacterium]
MPLIETQPDEVAQTYASSLFELAMAKGGQSAAEETLGELQDILEIARADKRFSEFLSSLVVPAGARGDALSRIFDGRASDLTVRFLRILNDKGRLSHLPAITQAFDEKAQAAFGRVEVDVYTAEPLDDAAKGVMRQKIADKLGKEVVLHAYTDPSMLGGVKLRVGDQLIDDSLATQLRRVRDKLIVEGGPKVRSRAGEMIDPNADPAAG